MPTEDQIAQVKNNITAIQALNDYVYDHSNALVLNAFLLMSEKDADPGLALGINILEGVFWALGGMLGAVGNFAASFLSGLVSEWGSNPPPNLNTTFAGMFLRFSAQSVEFDKQLAGYYQDPVSNWNKSFRSRGITSTLSDLSTFPFPNETDPEFESLASTALGGLDRAIWTTVLTTNFIITKWIPTEGEGQYNPTPFTIPGGKDAFPDDLADAYIEQAPSYFLVPQGWLPKSGCATEDRWVVQEYNLGTGVTGLSDGALSHDACNYLFRNRYTEKVVNPNGLFDRSYVFNSMGIRTASVGTNTLVKVQASVSNDYKRAMLTGNTLGALAFQEGRETVEDRIIRKAQEDPIFARRLSLRPRQTLEEFLGVKLPETVFFNVIVESDGMYALVIPRKELPVPRTLRTRPSGD